MMKKKIPAHNQTKRGLPYLLDVLSPAEKRTYRLLVLAWLSTLIWFWAWWLQLEHLVTFAGFLMTSAVLFWSTVVPAWFFYFSGRMKRPNPALPIPAGRVAMIVTKAPSEPWPVVRKTLLAMLGQKFPREFQVWLADENPTPVVINWCARHQVRISTRLGIAEYNQVDWPRRTKCKEGNLAYFYDHWGYAEYDFVVQLDADHAPAGPDYLRQMIAPFLDPRVGYVAAPSICDANKQESWTVRARLYAEAGLHGALQAGYNGDGWSPMMIGSHYAIRTQALKQIGGLGPELAEDASTTLFLNNGGWNGVFALDALAHGDGAASLEDSMTQEYQWSRSLMRLALEWTPKYSQGLSRQKKLEFFFAQWWYPTFALQIFLAIISPGLALLTKVPWVSVDYFDFVSRFTLLTIMCLLPINWIRNKGWFRPASAPTLSWETILFQFIRWPWIVVGCAHGLLASWGKKNFIFKITPKGKNKHLLLPIRTLLPYFFIPFFTGFLAIFATTNPLTEGYRWLGILDVATYSMVIAWVLFLHVWENPERKKTFLNIWPKLVTNIFCFVLVSASIITAIPRLEVVRQVQLAENPVGEFVGVRTTLPTATPTPQSLVQIVEKIAEELPRAHTPFPIVEFPRQVIFRGMYDPSNSFGADQFAVEHEFVDWNEPTKLNSAITAAQKKNRFPLLTVQPYHKKSLTVDKLLPDITAGLYDPEIIQMAAIIAQHAPQKVLVRWGHEMDLCRIYEWSTCLPGYYIPAYQHVVDLVRQQGVENVLWLWSPGGNINAPEFYPGDSYVDYVGLTLLVSEDWDRFFNNDPPYPQDLIQAFQPRYRRLAQFNKPLIIAELGISYSDASIDRTSWLTEGFKLLTPENFPLLRGWVYFNQLSPKSKQLALWPDFQISRAELMDSLQIATSVNPALE